MSHSPCFITIELLSSLTATIGVNFNLGAQGEVERTHENNVQQSEEDNKFTNFFHDHDNSADIYSKLQSSEGEDNLK